MSSLAEHRLSASGAGWAVAAPHHLASDAAAEVLRGGGNAVDGALAAAAVLTVVFPNQTSVGGDLLALVGTPDGDVRFVNASGSSARDTDVEAVLRGAGGRMPTDGAAAVTVPGVVSGWAALAERWGRHGVPGWRTSLSRAAELAREGFPVSAGLGRDLQREQRRLVRDPGMRELFFRHGEVIGTGQTLRQVALARSLDQLAEAGAGALYTGEVGKELLTFLHRMGSVLTAADLASHEVDLKHAHSTTFGGEEYLSSGGNSQGVFFLSALAALEELRQQRRGDILDPLGNDAGDIAAVLARSAADRDALCADPRFAPVPIDALLSESYARQVCADVRTGNATATARAGRAPARATGDTVAVVVADAEGNWISLIQSVFHCFGAGIADPATGIVLHNRGASFSARPDSPNRLAGGKRPMHTLMPVLVRRNGELVGSHGVMGGRAQPQIHAHLALGIAAGLPPDRAVAAPRWVLGALDEGDKVPADFVRAEQAVPTAALAAIAAYGMRVVEVADDSDEVGHAQVVRRSGSELVAAADPRADGAALAGPADAGTVPA